MLIQASTSFDVRRVCRLINTLTKIDIQYLDPSGQQSFRILNQSIPSILPYSNEEYADMMLRLKQYAPSTVEYYKDPHGLEFIASGAWIREEFQGIVVVGPFMSNTSDTRFMNQIISDNTLPVSQRTELVHFYKSLPVLTTDEYKALVYCIIKVPRIAA